MATRLDLVLEKHPDHEDEIRLLASRDPSGNLKYLDWAGKILASGQALAPEIADVLDLFHQFAGRFLDERRRGKRVRGKRVHPDIHTYRPQDLAGLRDLLLKIKRSQDRKRRKRERLYRIEGSIEADVIYDSPQLIVRHIKNKQASVHYGLGTKWCISMLREGYFEDYESHNAVFFFFERKIPSKDEFDKVAVMVPRAENNVEMITAFNSLDQQIDMMTLAKVYGVDVFSIFREIYEHSERHPVSAVSRVYTGQASREQLEAAFSIVVKGSLGPYDTDSLLESICCNDAAPQQLLIDIACHGPALSKAAETRCTSRRSRRRPNSKSGELTRSIEAALAIHPQMPSETREKIVSSLRKRRIKPDMIRRVNAGGRVRIEYRTPTRTRTREYHGRRRCRSYSLSQLRRRAVVFANMSIRAQKKLKKKIAENKKAARKKASVKKR